MIKMNATFYWLLNLVCAVVLLVLLGAHMGAMHLDGLLAQWFDTPTDPLAWDNMITRGRDPTVTTGYLVLLAAALFHGFYGLRTMLLEYFPGDRAARRINLACWGSGLTLMAVGSYATIRFLVRGAGF